MTLESSGKLWGISLQDILKEGKRSSRINFCITLVDIIAVIVTSEILIKLGLSSYIILFAIICAVISEFIISRLVNRDMLNMYKFYKRHKNKTIECYELCTTKSRNAGLPSRGIDSGLDLDGLIEVMLNDCRSDKSESRSYARDILAVFEGNKSIVDPEVDCTAVFKFIKSDKTSYLVDAEVIDL